MRILHVYKDIYPPVAGGIERHIDAIRRALPELTQDVLVCSRKRTTELRQPKGSPGDRERWVAEFGRPFSTPIAPAFPVWYRRMAPGAVVHLHIPNPTGELSVLAGPSSSSLVATYHCDVFRQRALLPLYKPFLLRCLARAEVTLVASPQLRDSSPVLCDHNGEIRLFPYGIDTESFDFQHSRGDVAAVRRRFGHPHVLAVGRLVAYKGFDQLVHAAAQSRWALVIVGEGPERLRLERMIRALGLSARVHLTGAIDDRELMRHLAAASLFALPSVNRAEAFGLSLLEAQAAGLPVVATDVGTGTAAALRAGQTGLLVPPRDPAALAGAIDSLLADEERSQAMGRAGAAWVRQEHSLQRMGDALREAYEEAAAAR